jgi:hypothetical protein
VLAFVESLVLKDFKMLPLDLAIRNLFKCESVIVFAKRVPAGSLSAESCVAYTHASNWLLWKLIE